MSPAKSPEKYQRSKQRNIERRESRRAAAEARQALRDTRTREQQLVLIDQRPGESRRERARLSAPPQEQEQG